MGPGPGPLGYGGGRGYWVIGVGGEGFRGDFCETIPENLDFDAAHILSLYMKKLSYSSRIAYIKKIRARPT